MKKSLLVLMTILSIGVAIYGWGLLFGQGIIQNAGMAHHFNDRPLAAFLHFGFGPLALAIGGFQFMVSVRARFPRFHRWLGRIYVLSCLLSAIGAVFLAINTDNGTVAMVGFMGLAAAWILTTSFAYADARARRFGTHRRWMIRSFALTFAAVTLRLYLPLSLGVMGLPFQEAYPVIAYACWIPNLLVAEWLLRRKALPVATAGAA